MTNKIARAQLTLGKKGTVTVLTGSFQQFLIGGLSFSLFHLLVYTYINILA